MRILFQGDSITDGNRIKGNDWDLNHQIGHSYAYIISALLGARHWDKQLEFFNRGSSGNRVADLYARLEEDTLSLKPDLLSILIGANDALRQPGDRSSRFGKVLRMLLDEVFEALPACRVVICEPFLLPVGQVQEILRNGSTAIDEVQAAVHQIAADYPVVYVPLQQEFTRMAGFREAAYWLWDGVHPTEAGHQIIADAWLAAVGKAQGIL